LKPKIKKYNHIFSTKEELEKCKNEPIYFYERYWLPYALNQSNVNIRDCEKYVIDAYFDYYGLGDNTFLSHTT